MRVMVLVKANADTEAGNPPDEKILTEMGTFNEELVKAGVMLAGEGLHPSSRGRARAVLRSEADRRHGPFAGTTSSSPASGSGR